MIGGEEEIKDILTPGRLAHHLDKIKVVKKGDKVFINSGKILPTYISLRVHVHGSMRI